MNPKLAGGIVAGAIAAAVVVGALIKPKCPPVIACKTCPAIILPSAKIPERPCHQEVDANSCPFSSCAVQSK